MLRVCLWGIIYLLVTHPFTAIDVPATELPNVLIALQTTTWHATTRTRTRSPTQHNCPNGAHSSYKGAQATCMHAQATSCERGIDSGDADAGVGEEDAAYQVASILGSLDRVLQPPEHFSLLYIFLSFLTLL